MGLLAAQAPNFSEVLNVRATKDGALYKGTLATDENGFEALTARALSAAKGHLDAICDGRAEIAPARFRQQNPCAYCDWRGVCLFDERMDARRVRRFAPLRADEAMEKIKLEDEC